MDSGTTEKQWKSDIVEYLEDIAIALEGINKKLGILSKEANKDDFTTTSETKWHGYAGDLEPGETKRAETNPDPEG
jgi:hypothetical protein